MDKITKCPQNILDTLDNCSGCVELRNDPLGGTHAGGTKQHPCPVCTKDHYPFCPQEQVKFTMQPNAVCTQCLLNKCICPERQSDGSWKPVPQEHVKPESHNTEDGYCCACEYDISVMNRKIKDTLSAQASEIVKMMKKYWYYAGKWHKEGCSFILYDQGVCNCKKINISTLIKEKYIN